MIDKIKKLLQNEDEKNPLTDGQIAVPLKIRREQVTLLRQKEGIPDSRQRRKPYVIKKIKEVLQKVPDISDRELTSVVKRAGFDISRHIIRQYRRELEPNAQGVKSKDNTTLHSTSDSFAHIVGFRDSLKPLIQQAKAAVLYPPRGLHTLILGEPGVGKSDLAEAMYRFAKEAATIAATAPFVFFNAADYADNPQLLMAHLFGYVKGAFTGAETDKEGLVEKADGGVLFLDEIHRLSPEGQELLFYLIDKGKFRRLGETAAVREANIMIIAATTEKPETSLLVTFRRRIPMVIEIPPLSSRPLAERNELITEFFHKEARRTKTVIEVAPDAIRAFILSDYPGNVGQLSSDIQVACARGFLNHIVNQDTRIKIDVENLSSHVRKSLLKIQNRMDMKGFTNIVNLVVCPDDQPVKSMFREDLYTLPSEIYQHIEQRYQELQKQGMLHEAINSIIGEELKRRFERMIKNIRSTVRPLKKKDLVKIVGVEVADVVEKMLRIAETKFGVTKGSLFYCLAIHLSTTLDRMRQGKVIVNPQLPKIRKEYLIEYKVAKEMVKLFEKTMKITLPEDEVGFVAMYLRMLTEKEEAIDEGRIGVVLVSHGHVANGMAEVANRLLGVDHAKSVEMALDESPETALDRTIEMVKNADEGKGVLLLVDMGSLVTFGEIITERTGIKTWVLSRTDTLMAIEALRKAMLPGITLAEIAETLIENQKYVTWVSKGKKSEVGLKQKGRIDIRPKAFVTICITGQGAAEKVKEMVEKVISREVSEYIEIIPIGVLNGDIYQTIADIQKSKDIIAIIGTINPSVKNIKFISVEDIIAGEGLVQIKEMIADQQHWYCEDNVFEGPTNLSEIITPELSLIDLRAKTKESVIEALGSRLVKNGYAKDDFVRGVFAREKIGITLFGNGVAVPHADPSYVIRPAVALAKLQNSIDWGEGQQVSVVFMTALLPSCLNVILDIYNITNSKEIITSLKKAKNFKEAVVAIDLGKR